LTKSSTKWCGKLEYIRCPSCKNDIPITYLFCPYCGLDLRFIIRERLIARLTFRDRVLRIYMLFKDPIRTVEHIATAPDMFGGFLCLLICSVLLLFKSIIIFSKYGIRLSSTAVGYLILSAMLTQLVLWMALAFLVNLSIRIVGGIGTFRDITSIVGYTQAYFIIAHVASLVVVATSSVPYDITQAPVSLGGAASVYIPFYIIIAVFAGYGISFTHMLKRITAISATVAAIVVFIVFFYVL